MSREHKIHKITNKFLVRALTMLLVLIFMVPLFSSGVSINTELKVLPNNERPIVIPITGYVFPNDVQYNTGISEDVNGNGVEDFIEYNYDLYSTQEYLNTIITLTGPASDILTDKLTALGCIIDHKFTIVDALGVSIPINRLEVVGRLPVVELIQGIREVKHDLNAAVPLTKASQDKLQSEGYTGINGDGVTIAVIDSGIDGGHSTFGNRIIAFRDFIYGNNDLDPTDGMISRDYAYHGTMCASCAAGSGTYKGVAIKSNLIAIAVTNTYHMIQAIEWCINNQNKDFNKDGKIDGPDVITMSLGLDGIYPILDNAAGAAMDNGIVFVTSAGNDGPGASTVHSPGSSSKVIAVGATDKYNKVITSFSSRGPGPGGIIKPNVVAPGLNLNVAYPGNQWTGGGTGTSFSGPIVAGICALILQYDPELDPYEVKQILQDSALDRGEEGPDNTYGWGFVDAVNALGLVLKVKSITPSATTVIEDTSVSFTAVASGTDVKIYEWDWDNDGIFDLETEDNSASHIFTNAGKYTIIAKVINKHGKSAEKEIDITVVNREPDAKFGIDGLPEYIYEDDVLTLNASRSWDTPSDINNLEYSWSFNDGVNFTNFSKKDSIIKHSFNDSGEYTLVVKVRDDNGAFDVAQISLVIENFKPIAHAGSDRTVYEDELVLFSAYNSYDTGSDLETLNYTWEFGNNKKGYGMNTTHTFKIEDDNETFTITLTVQDNDFDKSQDKVKIMVINQPPIITLGSDITAFEDDVISLSGFGNDSRNDRYSLVYQWDFNDETTSDWLEEPNVTHKYTKTGTYHPKLSVKDPKGSINSKSMNVTITNVGPKAYFEMSKGTAEEDELVEFNAGFTTDSESDLADLTYFWEFGDGSSGFGKTISHKFYDTTRYEVILKVIDDDGASSISEDNIMILNRVPTAKISMTKKEFQVNEIVRFFGFQSSDTPSDLRNLTYYWDFRDGKGFLIAGMNTTFKYSTPGEYVVRLKVEDADHEIDMSKVTIIITEPEKKEDIYANPTIENNGIYIYSGVFVFIVILIIVLLSLLTYYNNKKGLFGVLERKVKERRDMKEMEKQYDESRANLIGDSGLTIGQENFYKDLYGVHPSEFKTQQQQNMQMGHLNMNLNMNMNVKPPITPIQGQGMNGPITGQLAPSPAPAHTIGVQQMLPPNPNKNQQQFIPRLPPVQINQDTNMVKSTNEKPDENTTIDPAKKDD